MTKKTYLFILGMTLGFVPTGALAQTGDIASFSGPLLVILAGYLGGGVLMSLTPCNLPVVPILSSIIVGKKTSPRRGLFLSSVYVVSMSLTYSAVGIVVSSLGVGFQGFFQSPVVLIIFATFFVVLGLSMMGLFKIQLPSFLRDRLARMSQRQSGGSVTGVFLIGVLSALIVGPCMTAPLAGALLFIAESGDLFVGGLSLFVMGVGMGFPLLFVGYFGSRLMPKPGVWMNRINVVLGFVMLSLSVYFLDRIIHDAISLTLYSLVSLAFSIYCYREFIKNYQSLTKGLIAAAAVFVTYSVFSLPGALKEQSVDAFSKQFMTIDSVADFEEVAEKARHKEQWVFVDFYADWCVSCKSFASNTLSRTDVQNALSSFMLVKADITENSREHQDLMRHLRVLGPPTMLFVSPDGVEVKELRIVGDVSADAFLTLLRRINSEG